MIGLDHTTARIELRERVAFAHAEIPAALAQLTDPADPLLEQAAILSTCNRIELYGAARSAPSPEELVAFLARYHRLEPCGLSRLVYVHREDAVVHQPRGHGGRDELPRTRLGADPGPGRRRPQPRAQGGTAGPELRRLFEAAIAASRRIRSWTAIGRGVGSVPQASVEFARRRLGTLRQSTVLLIGAGNTGELAAKQLVKRRWAAARGRPRPGPRQAAGRALSRTCHCLLPPQRSAAAIRPHHQLSRRAKSQSCTEIRSSTR
ncbi:MAG: hypothetical protein JO179_11035, partial [Solirubrobacterales bacterium]|nr:hypothetical protein [Solirubrobacterales bacterium]